VTRPDSTEMTDPVTRDPETRFRVCPDLPKFNQLLSTVYLT